MRNATATAEKKALVEAFESVLKSKAAERAGARRNGPGGPGEPGPIRQWSTLLAVVIAGAALWVIHPAAIFPPAATPETVAVQEASLRIAMVNAAQHVEQYRGQHQRLPGTLRESGAPAGDFTYVEIDSISYQIDGGNGPMRLTLHSRDSLGAFLGNSMNVLARRGR